MRLVIFHYHLLPGGVTSVIRQATEALLAHSRQVERIQVVAGRIPPGSLPAGVEPVPEAEVDYAPARPVTRLLLRERAQRLADSLAKRFGGSDAVWWVHNYHLGKNATFTEAVLKLAASADGPRMILQPHDFPEAGRYEALARLDRILSLPRYPQEPRVRYALINPRDLDLVREAGIPACRSFLLENPVPAPQGDPGWGTDRRAMRSLLFPRTDPGHPVLLYPVRCIRRKNVVEAGMMTYLVDAPVRLVVTLPGVSAPEKAYSALVEGAFRSGLIEGEFGTGVRRPDLRLDRIAAACDAVVSSSVQEGFGYLFVQALQWGLPLIARSLDTVRGEDALYEGYPAVFYDGLRCPVEATERRQLLERYRAKLRRYRRYLGAAAAEKADETLSGMLSAEAVDVSFLDPPLQLRLLAAAAHVPGFGSTLRRMNAPIAQRMAALLSERPEARAQEIDRRMGLEAYARRMDEVLASFDLPAPTLTCREPAEVQKHIRAAFARPEYLRLLYD